jgi:cellulose synthase/poly-beta-1,6-N-acetylglucosamine synthase-like glycosyltransferase
MICDNKRLPIDVVIPVYGERPEALSATLSACLRQTHPISRIFVVDDGSPMPISLPEWVQSSGQVCLLRLAQNGGISVARNAGLADSNSPLVACINAEVLPDPDWLETCADYLCNRASVGAVYTRLVPLQPNRLLSQWRMRFLEAKFGQECGAAQFAPGHAVLFRREALHVIGGYDVRHRLHHEDSDICLRMRNVGWETHYIATSRCISIQEDSLKQVALKELRESYWYSPAQSSLIHLYLHLSKWTLIRAGRNLVKGRWRFLPLDAAIWACALWTATIRTLRFFLRSDGEIAKQAPE